MDPIKETRKIVRQTTRAEYRLLLLKLTYIIFSTDSLESVIYYFMMHKIY